MQRNSVASSNLASVGYDAATQTLEVEFLNGSIYQYYDVPESIYNKLIAAGSIGKFLYQNIRDAYECSMVE